MDLTGRFGVSFLPGAARDVVRWATVAEELGYARVGIGDSPALYRDPWMTLAVVAQATSTIPIGIWVTNPMTRHPLITASAARTLAELAPGRVFVGIATGDSGLEGAGLRPARIERLARYVQALRELLATGRTTYDGRPAHLSWPSREDRVPVYVAAHGERSIRLAGELADGVVFGLGVAPDVIAWCLAVLRDSAETVGRDIDDLDAWWTARYLVDEEPRVARDEMAGILAEAAHVFARTAFTAGLGPPALRPAVEQLAAEFDRGHYGGSTPEQRRAYARRAFELGVGDYLVGRYAFAGTPDECRAQVERAVAAGAHRFMYSMRGPDREGKLRAWERLVVRPSGPTGS